MVALLGVTPVAVWALPVSMRWPALMVVLVLSAVAVSLFTFTRRPLERKAHDIDPHVPLRSEELHLAAVEALALAIDAKDQTPPAHIRRVQALAVGVARALGLSEDDVLALRAAALLHDVGKLAVPEHILAKPGLLTPEEFQKIRIHPQVGAAIVATMPYPFPVAPLVLGHHERWDGKGYPSGLRGADIPLGARILAAVDCFEALISDRPYHRALTLEAAVDLLRQEAGKAFDPDVVATLVRVVEGFDLSLGAGAGGPTRDVFGEIAMAHREIYLLYDIAQALGTSMGVSETILMIAAKLGQLMPLSSCALFLYDDHADMLRCRVATGRDAALLQQVNVKAGFGLTGWVARNRRPLVNARPSADLEAAGLPTLTSLESTLICPLVCNERFVGALAVYHTEGGCYSDDHRRLLDRVCEQAAAVISNAIMFEETQEESLTDALTGLPNTRAMVMHLERELARARRLRNEVSLLVIDLDDFKAINDTHGHHVGDRALREVGRTIRASIRPYDICARYAGDEFLVALSGCGFADAERKRLELQEAIASTVVESRPGNPVSLACSIGGAVYPHDGDGYETLLAAADSRMYRDKARRKQHRPPAVVRPENRGVPAPPVPAAPDLAPPVGTFEPPSDPSAQPPIPRTKH